MVKGLPEAVEYSLVEIDDNVRRFNFTRAQRADFVQHINETSFKEESLTHLWAGFMSYFAEIKSRPGRHVLVVFSDGENTKRGGTYDEVVTAAKSMPVVIFAVGFAGSRNTVGGRFLANLADETGGFSMYPYAGQVDEVHRRIVREVRAQYSIGYVSTDETRDGRWRDVKIRPRRAEHKDLQVRTKRGYYAGKP